MLWPAVAPTRPASWMPMAVGPWQTVELESTTAPKNSPRCSPTSIASQEVSLPMKIRGRLAAARISAVLSMASSHWSRPDNFLLPEEWLADSVAAYDLLELGIAHLAGILYGNAIAGKLHLDVVAGGPADRTDDVLGGDHLPHLPLA